MEAEHESDGLAQQGTESAVLKGFVPAMRRFLLWLKRYTAPFGGIWYWLIGEPDSRLRRWKLFFTGVIVPAICIGAALCGTLPTVDSPWQSGHMIHYVTLLFRPWTLSISLPLILFSAISLTWWLWRPDAVERKVVRFGIYTGAILASQYLVMVMICSSYVSLWATMFYVPALVFIGWVWRCLYHHWRRFTILHLIGLTTVVAALMTLGMYLSREHFRHPNRSIGMFPLEMLFGCLVGTLAAGAPVNCITYLRAAFAVFVAARKTESDGVGAAKPWFAMWFGWLTTWGVIWKISVDRMMAEYATLPTTNPNCYVCSAAASGHRRLVGAQSRPDGVVVNTQMRRLKFLEFALAATSPACHRWLRRWYNRRGPGLARFCRRNVWFADATYLALKPLEWFAESVRRVASFSQSSVNSIYGS